MMGERSRNLLWDTNTSTVRPHQLEICGMPLALRCLIFFFSPVQERGEGGGGGAGFGRGFPGCAGIWCDRSVLRWGGGGGGHKCGLPFALSATEARVRCHTYGHFPGEGGKWLEPGPSFALPGEEGCGEGERRLLAGGGSGRGSLPPASERERWGAAPRGLPTLLPLPGDRQVFKPQGGSCELSRLRQEEVEATC